MSDGGISELQHDIYMLDVVSHSENFVYPVHEGIHTEYREFVEPCKRFSIIFKLIDLPGRILVALKFGWLLHTFCPTFGCVHTMQL